MDIHLLMPQGDQLVVQVVEGQVIVPSAVPAAPAVAPAQPAPGK